MQVDNERIVGLGHCKCREHIHFRNKGCKICVFFDDFGLFYNLRRGIGIIEFFGGGIVDS